MEKILVNDLDFCIFYDSWDEMGELIEVFENMCLILEKNVRMFWWLVEECKKLNVIFVYDLRILFLVLKGNIELFVVYLLEKKLFEEKVLELIYIMNFYIVCFESYVEVMNLI